MFHLWFRFMWTEVKPSYSRLPPKTSHTWFIMLFPSPLPQGRMFGNQALKMLDENGFTDQEHIFSILCEQEIYFLLFEPLHVLKSIYNSLSEESYFLFIQFHLMVGFSLNSENLILEYLFLKGNERSWENKSYVSFSHLHCSAF